METTISKVERKTKKAVTRLSWKDASAAALTKKVAIFTLSPGTIITATAMNVKTVWDGGTTVTASLGVTGYDAGLLVARSIKSTGLKTEKGTRAKDHFLVFPDGAEVSVIFTSTESNLDQSTQGEVEVTLLLETS